MRNLLIWFFGTESSFGRKAGLNRPPTPTRTVPTATPALPEDSPQPGLLQPLNNWCHPFKDTRNPLEQLTHLAKANAGYYPLGRSGLWHGGVHFDSGTASTLKQSSVHCLADGEVVAYRIDTHSPSTPYIGNKQAIEKPFSRNFVLVRHRLQPPKIEGISDTPPSLIFYSLYMHLQDWAVYRDSTLIRPAFWPVRPTYRVKQSANDFLPDKPERRGLNIRHRSQGQVIDLLPRGAEVAISGTGKYRKLERTLGPAELLNPDGSIKGYIAASVLKEPDRKETRVQSSQPRVNVRADPLFAPDNVIFELPAGSEVTVSGTGEFRKLVRINQYVHFDSLENAIEPVATDEVVVLDTPVSVKAGDLIGHLGQYHSSGASQSEEKLHLETFSGDDVELFIKASRAWADSLPEKDKTWLKLAKGTPVVAPEGNLTATQLQVASASSPLSAADLLVPKTLLDKLPTDHKLQMPASPTRKACTWYRLEGLLHDANNAPLDGWVREEIGVTPWVSPWAWEGYDVIYEYDVPQEFLASFLRAIKQLNEVQLERFGPMADEGDTGPLKNRLYDIIDRNRDGRMTADELRAAISLPAHAQAISQLIVCCDSEWYYKEGKWDRLDELLGHSGSTPNLNWFAEKRRIKQLNWWNEVASKVGLPGHGEVYHFHPVGLVGRFPESGELIRVEKFVSQYESEHVKFALGTRALTESSKENLGKIINSINEYYKLSSQQTNIYEVSYMLATARHEAYYFLTGEFFSEKPEVGPVSYFNKYDPVLAPTSELRTIARSNGNTEEGDGYKYRGRGCVHLTWKSNYQKFSKLLSFDFVSYPEAAAKFEYSIPIMIIGMTKGMFTGKKLSDFLTLINVDYASARKIINGEDEKDLIASYAKRFEEILKSTSRLVR